MIDTIVFDLGNVLVDFHPTQGMEELGFSKEAIEAFNQHIFPTIWEKCDEAPYSLEEVKKIQKAAVPGYEGEVDLLWSDRNVQKLTSVYEYSKDWLSDLKNRGYKIYILSNFGKQAFEINSQIYDFLQYTDGRVMSFEESMIKPNPKLYQCLSDRYGVRLEHAVFIDDRLINVEGARNCHMKGILFENYEQAKKELEIMLSEE